MEGVRLKAPCTTHMWHSYIMIPSRVLECDWCVVCEAVRPGYMDPKLKWDKKRTRRRRRLG